jgi:hypothetical protein
MAVFLLCMWNVDRSGRSTLFYACAIKYACAILGQEQLCWTCLGSPFSFPNTGILRRTCPMSGVAVWMGSAD